MKTRYSSTDSNQMRRKTMSNLKKQQATNALEWIKFALRAGNQDKAVERVQQIFEAGFQHGVNSIFESIPNKE